MTQEISDDDFRSSPIWRDITSTILSGPKVINYDSLVRIHTPEGDFNVIKVKEYEDYCDYVRDTASSEIITFELGLGDYVYKLYPFRNLLEVSIKKVPQNEEGGDDIDTDTFAYRYRGILSAEKNPVITGTKMSTTEYHTLQNSNEMVTVVLDLVDRNFEVLRVGTLPGWVYQQVTPKQLIEGLMVGQSQKYLIDGEPAIKAMNIVEPDNSAPIHTAVIEPNIKIVGVASYVQEMLTGVYSTGLGTFFSRYKDIPAWFVYPLYKTDRFNKGGERVVIFSVPQDMLSGLDRTYRKSGEVLYIAATGPRQYADDSKVSDLNQGVGFRQPDATGLITKPIDITPDGPIADRARLNTEIANRERSDGLYFAPMVKPSVNPFKNYSKVASRAISTIEAVWENSLPDLIYPGMPCKYVFMDSGEYREVTGTILGKYSTSQLIGATGTSNSYRTATKLGMALEYYEGTPKQPVLLSPGVY